jgi:hypothetical protein
MFGGWIHDHLKPRAAELKVAGSVDVRAIAAAKRRMIVSTPTRYVIACIAILLPECYMEPTAIHERIARLIQLSTT